MGKVSIQNYNEQLMLSASYKNKKNIKHLLKVYEKLYDLGCFGDSVALSIFLDLKYAIFESGDLTEKQKTSLIMYYMQGFTLQEIAFELKKDETTVHRNIDGACKKIMKILGGDDGE